MGIDLQKYARLDKFLAARIDDVYPEPPDDFHGHITKEAIVELNEKFGPINGWKVLDIGCGQGVALEIFEDYGADALGICVGSDVQVCRNKMFHVEHMDFNFLEFEPESFDLVWARHVLEHSTMPFFALSEIYNVLKHGGIAYVEVPAPETTAQHHNNPNHYSCLTQYSWGSLMHRTGFTELLAYKIQYQALCGPDEWYVFYLRKP
jgi:ubiquinone/menaquinone biosynthesis C-methylase UbiE